MHPIQPRIELLEQILAPWQTIIGSEFAGYKNHCYRMLHFCFVLAPDLSDEQRQKLIIASAHHDLGLWSEGTVDYIPPSIVEAKQYCHQQQLAHWEEEITLLIAEHHKLKPDTNQRYPLIEVFRRADLVNFSLGLMRQGISKSTIKQVQSAFPNHGFHRFLLKGAWAWFSRHPLTLPPFMKW